MKNHGSLVLGNASCMQLFCHLVSLSVEMRTLANWLAHSLTHSLRYCAHSKASSSVGSLPNSQPISFRNNQSGFWWWSTINDSYLLANPMFLRATGGKPKAKILVTQWPRQAIRSPPIYALTRGCLLTIFFDHWTSWSADPQTCAPP